MTDSKEKVEPPDDLPELLITELEQSSDEQLRTIIHYAQDLLRQRKGKTQEIEPREGEEIIRKDDHGSYTLVIVKNTQPPKSDQGLFAYRVQYEYGPENEEGRYRWHYLGPVEE